MDELLLWAEDLQCHREPSLYYLSDEEGADGPHLICDWNGSPTDFNELDIDIISMIREKEMNEANQQDENLPDISLDNDSDDYPNPTTEVAKSIQSSNSYFSLGFDDRSLFDFLSVPPITSGLLRRIVRGAQSSKTKTTIRCRPMSSIPEQEEMGEDVTMDQTNKWSKSRKTARASTSKPIKMRNGPSSESSLLWAENSIKSDKEEDGMNGSMRAYSVQAIRKQIASKQTEVIIND